MLWRVRPVHKRGDFGPDVTRYKSFIWSAATCRRFSTGRHVSQFKARTCPRTPKLSGQFPCPVIEQYARLKGRRVSDFMKLFQLMFKRETIVPMLALSFASIVSVALVIGRMVWLR